MTSASSSSAQLDSKHTDWEDKWQKGTTQWDAGCSSPALVNLVKERYENAGKVASALIPGCGRGYDLLTIASIKGIKTVVGAELSATAAATAQTYVDERKGDSTANLIVKQADFFELPNQGQKYDLIYDYTFFCALHPSMRQRWATTMAKLVSSTGELVALEFPLDKPVDQRDIGPPFLVSHEAYKEVLEKEGFRLVEYRSDVQSHGPRQGKEALAVWRLEANKV